MACYLRGYGATFDVDAFTRTSSLPHDDVWRVGETRSVKWPKAPLTYEDSGLQMVVGKSEDIKGQANEAIAFLKLNGDEIRRLANAAGIDSIKFDFSLWWEEGVGTQFVGFPPELLRLLGAANCGLEVSYYGVG